MLCVICGKEATATLYGEYGSIQPMCEEHVSYNPWREYNEAHKRLDEFVVPRFDDSGIVRLPLALRISALVEMLGQPTEGDG